MRLFIGAVLAVVCVILMAVPVYGRPFRQTHTIEIKVECMDAATAIIRELDGYNLDASVFSNEMYVRNVGRPGFTRVVERRANFTRRVDYRHFRHVQEVLRGMGEVLSESENARFLGTQIMDVDARLATIEQELERLLILMAASTSLDVLIAIDIRLSQVNWERNSLIGRRNVLLTQAASPVLHIMLVEPPEDLPEFVPPTFGSRVAERFSDSLWGTLTAAGNFVVFIVRISIPFAALCAIFALGIFMFYLVIRRMRSRRPALVMGDMDVPDEVMETTAPYEITDAATAEEKEGEA